MPTHGLAPTKGQLQQQQLLQQQQQQQLQHHRLRPTDADEYNFDDDDDGNAETNDYNDADGKMRKEKFILENDRAHQMRSSSGAGSSVVGNGGGSILGVRTLTAPDTSALTVFCDISFIVLYLFHLSVL